MSPTVPASELRTARLLTMVSAAMAASAAALVAASCALFLSAGPRTASAAEVQRIGSSGNHDSAAAASIPKNAVFATAPDPTVTDSVTSLSPIPARRMGTTAVKPSIEQPRLAPIEETLPEHEPVPEVGDPEFDECALCQRSCRLRRVAA